MGSLGIPRSLIHLLALLRRPRPDASFSCPACADLSEALVSNLHFRPLGIGPQVIAIPQLITTSENLFVGRWWDTVRKPRHRWPPRARRGLAAKLRQLSLWLH